MRFFILIITLAFATQLSAQSTATVRSKEFNLEKGIAIQGYDPVAYFVSNKAIKGKSAFSANYLGVVYYFSSSQIKSSF